MQRVSLAVFVGVLSALTLILTISNQQAEAQGVGGINLTKIGDFSQPLYVTQAKGGPLVVVEQTGKVKAQKNGKWVTFLDLTNETRASGEQGLLGLAFPPNYKQKGYFYVNLTNKQGHTRVIEYKRQSKYRAKKSSKRVILKVRQPYSNHNGGSLQFTRQGDLLIGMGDGGSGGDPHNHAQRKDSLLGKLLRIDPRPKMKKGRAVRPYKVPSSNPFVGKKGRDEIYSLGLRNPWRFSVDQVGKSETLWIADVGQGDVEEVNKISLKKARKANFGWSAFEGRNVYDSSRQAPKSVKPVITYGHTSGRCSVTGGYRVRGDKYPSLTGRYLYGDFCSGDIWSFASGQSRLEQIRVDNLSSFGRDVGGNLYATSSAGGVYRLTSQAPARLQVRESEFEMTLSRSSVPSGQIIIEVLNRGEDPHDFFIQKQFSSEPAQMIPELEPGAKGELAITLSPGVYRLWCGIEGHDQAGMNATLSVE